MLIIKLSLNFSSAITDCGKISRDDSFFDILPQSVIAEEKFEDNFIISNRFDISLCMVHINCLFGNHWLNDEILSVQCCIMNEASTKNHFFSPVFYDALMGVEKRSQGGRVIYSAKGYDYKNMGYVHKGWVTLTSFCIFFP